MQEVLNLFVFCAVQLCFNSFLLLTGFFSLKLLLAPYFFATRYIRLLDPSDKLHTICEFDRAYYKTKNTNLSNTEGTMDKKACIRWGCCGIFICLFSIMDGDFGEAKLHSGLIGVGVRFLIKQAKQSCADVRVEGRGVDISDTFPSTLSYTPYRIKAIKKTKQVAF